MKDISRHDTKHIFLGYQQWKHLSITHTMGIASHGNGFVGFSNYYYNDGQLNHIKFRV